MRLLILIYSAWMLVGSLFLESSLQAAPPQVCNIVADHIGSNARTQHSHSRSRGQITPSEFAQDYIQGLDNLQDETYSDKLYVFWNRIKNIPNDHQSAAIVEILNNRGKWYQAMNHIVVKYLAKALRESNTSVENYQQVADYQFNQHANDWLQAASSKIQRFVGEHLRYPDDSITQDNLKAIGWSVNE